MEDKEKGTALEVSVQEQQENIYPVEITIISGIGGGTELVDNEIIDSSEAIKLKICIDSNKYDKKKVYDSINIACQKLLKYYL